MTDTNALADEDHLRGCEGRNYTCTCGYDNRVEEALRATEAYRNRAQRAEQALAERDAEIVAWLRSLHERGDSRDMRNPNFVELIAVFSMVANAIERGDYKESQP